MTSDPVLELLERCSRRIGELADVVGLDDGEQLKAGAGALSASLESVRYLPSSQATAFEGHLQIPVTSSLDCMDAAPLVSSIRGAKTNLPWTSSHRISDGGTEAALAPLNYVLDFDSHGLVVGLLLLGQNCEYPLHQHPPQELYLTISGTALWRFGGATSLVKVSPDRLIYNHPNDLHRIVASTSPILAFYVLW